MEAIGQIEGIGAVLGYLQHEDFAIRMGAVQALAQIAEKGNQPVIDALTAALQEAKKGMQRRGGGGF